MCSVVVGKKPTILIVDDEEGIRTFLSDLLTGSGFHVLVAADAQQALQQSAAYNGEIHLLLSDIQMPPGMTGIDLAIRLHRDRPAIKVMLMSGVCTEERAFQEGWDFLRKPFRAERLQKNILRLLSEDPAARAHAAPVGA